MANIYETPETLAQSFGTEQKVKNKREDTLRLWLSEGFDSIKKIEEAAKLCKEWDDKTVKAYMTSIGVEKLSADERSNMRKTFKELKLEQPDRISRFRQALSDASDNTLTVKGKDLELTEKEPKVEKEKPEQPEKDQPEERTLAQIIPDLIEAYGFDTVMAELMKHSPQAEAA